MDAQTIIISSPESDTEATFVPAANMVCSSLRHHGVELLEARRGLKIYAETGKTMGIPFLYPWANRLERLGYEAAGKTVLFAEGDERIPLDSAGLPIHGVLPSLLRWEVRETEQPNVIDAKLRWNASELVEVFPYIHEVHLRAAVVEGGLNMTTTIKPTGPDRVPVSFGYHPYLRLAEPPRDEWDVLLPASRRLVLDARGIPTGEREDVAERAFRLNETSWDTAFDGLEASSEFGVKHGDTSRIVRFCGGYNFAQLFAPTGQNFISFEPMTAASNALNSGDGVRIVSPGEEYRAAFELRVVGVTR